MTDEKVTPATVLGCFVAMWSMLVTAPMWLILLFLILSGMGDNAPVAAWVLYWCYVPAYVVGVTFSSLFANLLRDEKGL